MIEEYLKEKENQIHIEKLTAWRDFYLDCNNGWKATIMEKKIERFKKKL